MKKPSEEIKMMVDGKEVIVRLKELKAVDHVPPAKKNNFRGLPQIKKQKKQK